VHYPGVWDFEKNKNDFIFINLGTNDANYVNADREERKDEFLRNCKRKKSRFLYYLHSRYVKS
jgi:hypothetical protein